MSSNSRGINQSNTDTPNLIDFDREPGQDERFSTMQPNSAEPLRYGDPPLPPKNGLSQLRDLQQRFHEARQPAATPNVSFMEPSSRTLSTTCYDDVDEFRMSAGNKKVTRAVRQPGAGTNLAKAVVSTAVPIQTSACAKEDSVHNEKKFSFLVSEEEAGLSSDSASRTVSVSESLTKNSFTEKRKFNSDDSVGATRVEEESMQMVNHRQSARKPENATSCHDDDNSACLLSNVVNLSETANSARHDAKCVDIFCAGGDNCVEMYNDTRDAHHVVEQMKSYRTYDELMPNSSTKARMEFSAEEIKQEKRAIHTIHAVLRCQGQSSPQQIFDVLPDYAELLDRPVVFSTCEELEDFISHRAFLFEVLPHSNLVCNRGNGYREGIHLIALWVKELSVHINGCKVDELWKRVVNNLLPFDSQDKCNMNDTWFTLQQITSARDFVELLEKNHPDIFTFLGKDIIHQAFVQINPIAFKIPSLWMSECFNRRNKDINYDRSRVEQLFIKIHKTDVEVAQGYVIHGQFRGRIVELQAKNFGRKNMLHMTPLKAAFYVQAHYVFNEAEDFIAVAATSVESCLDSLPDRCNISAAELEIISSNFPATNCSFTSSSQLGEIVATEFEPNGFLIAAQLQRIQKELECEKKKIDFATQFIKKDTIAEEVCKTKFVRNEENPFSSVVLFLHFLKTRSHLFNYEDGNISRIHHKERVFIRQLIDFLSKFSNGLDFQEIENRVLVGQAGEALANCTNTGYLNRYISFLKPMLTHEENMDAALERFCLKGTYLPRERILLPFYCIDGVRRVCF